jgi:protein TonB
VAFETWSETTRDSRRLKRLLLGASVGTIVVVAGIAAGISYSANAVAEVEEEDAKVVDVELANEPEPKPAPPAPAPPELEPRKPNPGPKRQKLEVPTTIKDEKLQEKDVEPSEDGGEDAYERGGGDGSTGQKPVVESPVTPPAPPPPPPPLPKEKKAVSISEGMTPPEPIVKLVKPEYPADAKAAGLEGVVVVRYVVDEQGDVTDVKAVKGPPELHSACVAAIKAMRFKPALDADGKPVMVVRYMKFPFKLRTRE